MSSKLPNSSNTSPKAAIHTNHAPEALGPYSQATQTGPWLFLSGQIPLLASGQLCPGGIREQTQQVLKNLQAILEAAGGTLDNIMQTTCYLCALSDFQAFNEVYAQHFNAPFPARATVEVKALPKNALVEISALACLV
ncbi:MAG: RidA family protein [Proteobacteria bacterium]|nr:RidA family protein [Cystobacterineae bacterium]MCL2258477.1 RidA family protein [Cystobacterineae bacterium]MCL2315183.1 RidA family protein [Pseudomonadota bacterium]